ncbi:hypothetical protein Csa_022296 [Cucumis sativus]|uniref:Uncharacterized protein n=1 Tax=Cucumis sativus TaxID=3659 RepID=A0A0A0LL87_CUCSA|nr:hypothetical protein Csa_022296 [Cucumis sativus]
MGPLGGPVRLSLEEERWWVDTGYRLPAMKGLGNTTAQRGIIREDKNWERERERERVIYHVQVTCYSPPSTPTHHTTTIQYSPPLDAHCQLDSFTPLDEFTFMHCLQPVRLPNVYFHLPPFSHFAPTSRGLFL